MAEYIERTEEIMLAMNAGARAIENTERYHGAVYTKDVLSENPQKIPYLLAAKVLREVSDTSAADVAQVVHGRWNVVAGRKLDNAICSNCGRHFQAYYEAYRFCPNCGAKMDGGDSN